MIETDAQAQHPAQTGVKYGQGYVFGRPGPTPTMPGVLARKVPPKKLVGGTRRDWPKLDFRPKRGHDDNLIAGLVARGGGRWQASIQASSIPRSTNWRRIELHPTRLGCGSTVFAMT